jgi:tetratricopeptide (TPR) repeat protein
LTTPLRPFVSALLCLILAGCASVPVEESLSDYGPEITRLERTLKTDPQAVDALRDLGAIYMRTGNPLEASRYLTDGYAAGSRDPKLLFYLGMANESLGKTDTALRLYETYPDLPSGNEFRRLMAGRYSSLIRQISDDEMQVRLQNESRISAAEVVENAVAVFALEYQGNDPSYAGIGRGLAEWFSLDLIKVSQLSVLERVRLQSLLDEIDLGKTGYVDPATAPRAGRLLRAGRVVSGTYNVLSDDRLQVVTAHVETNTSAVETLPTQEDALDNFFRLEKRLVFALLADLGIELTEAEQNAIDEVPTRDLQAFLAYSRGLMSEDQRDFRAASAFFQQAATLDPTFEAAGAKSEEALGMEATFGPSTTALASAQNLEPLAPTTIDPVSDRLESLGITIESPIVPSEDTRKPAVEAVLPGALPDPPRPPGK